jgi:hypothetical protein
MEHLSELRRYGAICISIRHDEVDSLIALQYIVGQMAGVPIKDLTTSEAKSCSGGAGLGCGLDLNFLSIGSVLKFYSTFFTCLS